MGYTRSDRAVRNARDKAYAGRTFQAEVLRLGECSRTDNWRSEAIRFDPGEGSQSMLRYVVFERKILRDPERELYDHILCYGPDSRSPGIARHGRGMIKLEILQ